MLLEDEIGPPSIEFVLLESPPTCTPWSCIGHETREEMNAIHDAVDAALAEARRPS